MVGASGCCADMQVMMTVADLGLAAAVREACVSGLELAGACSEYAQNRSC